MNDNAKKWVEALRSGEFEQGRTMLHSEDHKYCCLGVACELYNQETDKPLSMRKSHYDGSYAYGEESDTTFLPKEVQDWIGLRHRDGSVDENQDAASLWYLNDGSPDSPALSFDAIADYIESEPEGLFR